jgi:hypothetical protein
MARCPTWCSSAKTEISANAYQCRRPRADRCPIPPRKALRQGHSGWPPTDPVRTRAGRPLRQPRGLATAARADQRLRAAQRFDGSPCGATRVSRLTPLTGHLTGRVLRDTSRRRRRASAG